MKQNAASRRMAEQLREKLGYILLYEVSDPDLELVSITGCEVAIDRSFARVWVSCDRERYAEVLGGFDRARGRIRSILGRALKWRVTPELEFRIDESTDEAERIGRALRNAPATIGVEKDEEGYPVRPADEAEAADEPDEGAAAEPVAARHEEVDGA